MAAGFMAGFGTNFAKLMEEDRQYFREQAAKKKDYIQTYGTRAVTDREDKANSVMAVVNNLQTRGFKPSTVRYVLDNNGITGLMELQDTASRRTDITKDEIDSIVTKAADYVSKNPDEDMQTVIRRAFGLYKSEANPVKRDRNAFSAILGFDNAMLEDEVLDDMYINGYTGRDIYRISGSAGPRAGAALQLDLPTEPLSPTAQKLYADVMLDQMESGIDARIVKLKTDYNKEGSDKMSLQNQIDALETLKGRGYDGIATYAKLDPSIFEYARALNEDTPGSIVNNGFLYGFESAFNDYFEEKKPEVKTKTAQGLTDDYLGLPSVPVGDGLSTKPEPKVMTFKTAEEFNKAVEAGEVASGQQVQIGSGSVSIFTPPKEEPKMTDLGDMTGAPGFRDMTEPNPELTVEERVTAKKDAAQGVIDAVDSNVASFTQTLDKGFASGALTANAYGNTLLGGVAQIVGADGAADFFYTQAVKSEDGIDSTEGLVPAINSILDKLGVPDYSKQDEPLVDLQSAVDAVMSAIPAIPKEDSFGRDLDVALLEAPDHIEKLGDQAMDAWRKLTATVPTEAPKSYTQEEILAWYENRVSTQEKADMEKRIRDDARQFLQDEKSFPQPLPRIVIDTLTDDVVEEAKVDREVTRVVQQLDNKGETPSPKDIEDLKTTLELNQEIDTSTDELYRGPISGKTLVEKLDDIWNFYTSEEPEYDPRAIGTVGFRDLGLRDTTDDVRPPRGEAPDRAASLARGASPEGDDLPAEMPRNMAVENFTTRGINATPRGLMTPNRESAPKLGQAEFGDLIQRVHGSSKAAEAFNKKVSSGKLTAADVTRLLKATRKLPETASRQRLIMSLFNLRDGLNKR